MTDEEAKKHLEEIIRHMLPNVSKDEMPLFQTAAVVGIMTMAKEIVPSKEIDALLNMAQMELGRVIPLVKIFKQLRAKDE